MDKETALTKDELRAEEDFFESKGLTICDGCAHEGNPVCRTCKHRYESMYAASEVVNKLRA